MKPYLTSGIAALIVSAGFAGAAAAQDMYSNPEGLPQSPPTIQQSRGQDVDRMPTGSIVPYGTTGSSWNSSTGNADLDGGQDEGDYYDGAYRPHN
jgi:hypothetical protein